VLEIALWVPFWVPHSCWVPKTQPNKAGVTILYAWIRSIDLFGTIWFVDFSGKLHHFSYVKIAKISKFSKVVQNHFPQNRFEQFEDYA